MSTRSEFQASYRNESSTSGYERLAKGLGWFSIALGATQVLAPRAITNVAGIEDDPKNRTLLRSPLYGLREIAAGTGILTQPKPAAWLWARVAGDVIDLGSLGLAMTSRDNDRGRLTAALAGVLGVTALDVLCAVKLSEGRRVLGRRNRRQGRSLEAIKSIWVNKPPEEAYRFWRNFENLPRFMHHLESVQSTGDGRTRWRVVGPLGRTFEWEAKITDDRPNRLIAWRSVDGSEIKNSGHALFEPAPGGRGTIVHVEMSYEPPGGILGASVAKLFGKEGNQMLEDDLRAFKQVLETGEMIQSDASIHPLMHPGQPPRETPQTRQTRATVEPMYARR
jgi:uncharacterized membrane protein